MYQAPNIVLPKIQNLHEIDVYIANGGYNAYKKADLSEKQYHSFLSSKQMTTFIARALSGITGAALYAIHPSWPFIALTIATLGCAAIGLLI